MISVKFGAYDSYTDLGMVLTSRELSSPSAKTISVDVEGGDGELDLTDFFGQVRFENRNLKLTFALYCDDLVGKFAAIQQSIHGRKMQVSFDNEQVYYVGRVNVEKLKIAKNIGTVTITVDCEPYRYYLTETVKDATVAGSQVTLVCPNKKRPVIPTIIVTGTVTIKFGDTTIIATDGIHNFAEIEFTEGDNELILTGSGTITVKYREGIL